MWRIAFWVAALGIISMYAFFFVVGAFSFTDSLVLSGIVLALAAAWIVHQDWLTSPDVPQGRRNAPVSQARVGCSVWKSYEDRWDLLGTPTDDVPVLLPSSLQERAQLDRVGLPPGHPWVTRPPEWSPAE